MLTTNKNDIFRRRETKPRNSSVFSGYDKAGYNSKQLAAKTVPCSFKLVHLFFILLYLLFFAHFLFAYIFIYHERGCPNIYRLSCFFSSTSCPNKHHRVQHKLSESSCHLAANQHTGLESYFQGLPRVLYWTGNLLHSLAQECNSGLHHIGSRVSWSVQVHQLHCVCRGKNKQGWSEQRKSERFHRWRQ